MGVGNQHQVGFRQQVVGCVSVHGIDVNRFAIHLDGKRGVFEKGDREGRSVAGREGIRRIVRNVRVRAARLGEGENEEAHKQNRFHGFRTNSVHSFAS